MPDDHTELVLKTKRGWIEFSWCEGDLAIDAENSNERVMIFLDPVQTQELLEYLSKKPDATTA